MYKKDLLILLILPSIFLFNSVYGQEDTLELNNSENADTDNTNGLFFQNLILGFGTLIVSFILSFGVYKIRKVAQKFREDQLEANIRKELIELFHESINLVYSKEISLIREICHRYSSDEHFKYVKPNELDDSDLITHFYAGEAEPKQIFDLCNNYKDNEELGLPKKTFQTQYEDLRISLNEQRDKQLLFLAKIQTYSKGDKDNFDYFKKFIELRRDARYATYLVRQIIESVSSEELSCRVENFYKIVTDQLRATVTTYSGNLSHKLIIDPICLECSRNKH